MWVTYTDAADSGDVEALAAKVEGQPYSFMSPYSDQESSIVLTAWGVQLGVDDASDDSTSTSSSRRIEPDRRAQSLAPPAKRVTWREGGHRSRLPRWLRWSSGPCWARFSSAATVTPSTSRRRRDSPATCRCTMRRRLRWPSSIRDRTDDPELRADGVRHHQHPARPDRDVQRLAAAVGAAADVGSPTDGMDRSRPQRVARCRRTTTCLAWRPTSSSRS